MDIAKLAWLAGLFDGEGTIGFYRAKRKNGRDVYQKNVGISCGDVRIINQASEILAEIVGHPIVASPDYRPSKLRPSVYFRIGMRKQEDLQAVLTCLVPYLVGKKAEALLMLSLLKAHKKYSLYTQEHAVIEEALKIAKKAGFQSGNPELNTGMNREMRRDYIPPVPTDTGQRDSPSSKETLRYDVSLEQMPAAPYSPACFPLW